MNTASKLIESTEAFFGLHDSPFKLTPDTRYLVSLSDHNNAFNMLMYAIESGEGFIKVTGEVGLGKTFICRRLLKALSEDHQTLYIPNPRLSPHAMKKAIGLELGIDSKRQDDATLLTKINQALIDIGKTGKKTIMLIDEAQNIPTETLEDIRMISNLETEQSKLLQIVFFGQPEFDELLNTKLQRPLKQRIGFSYQLKPLDADGVYTYVVSRMRFAGYKGYNPFSSWAIRCLKKASKGSPRLINILSHKALLLAYNKNRMQVKRADIVQAAEDTDSAVKPFFNHHWYWLIPAALTPVVVFAAKVFI